MIIRCSNICYILYRDAVNNINSDINTNDNNTLFKFASVNVMRQATIYATTFYTDSTYTVCKNVPLNATVYRSMTQYTTVCHSIIYNVHSMLQRVSVCNGMLRIRIRTRNCLLR